MGSNCQFTAADGHVFSGYQATPTGPTRGAIIVLQEIFGVNSHIRAVVDSYAAEGYVAVAPALFDRVKPGIELGYSADDIARGRELKQTSAVDRALMDIQAAVAAVAGHGNVGVVGYCWGGSLAWLAAARIDEIKASVPYYGGEIAANLAAQPRCPTLLHFGARDHMIPPEAVADLRAAHPALPVHVYDADHGFNCDQRASYDATAAALARERSLAFFAEHLG